MTSAVTFSAPMRHPASIQIGKPDLEVQVHHFMQLAARTTLILQAAGLQASLSVCAWTSRHERGCSITGTTTSGRGFACHICLILGQQRQAIYGQ